MHLQVIRYRLAADEGDYLALCERLAPRFADVPGLLAKVWLRDPAGRVYGGAYLWWDQESSRRFAASDLLAEVIDSPRVTDVEVTEFAVLDEPTRVTLGILAPRHPFEQAAASSVGSGGD
ncbi:MAG TPA: YdhR family protein [Thermomicrobiales bacterium]|nr:YdhR family protein [Thermomicrobiales bacterium]